MHIFAYPLLIANEYLVEHEHLNVIKFLFLSQLAAWF